MSEMMETTDEIAIVGIGCNFPGGEGTENFWQVLVEGRNCTVEIPPERFDSVDWYDPDSSKPGKTSTKHAALIDEFNTFDHLLFGINGMEAGRMDPQQKLLLECTYRALEDAGLTRENISNTKTGVFVGVMNRDYELVSRKATTEINHYDGTGAAMSITANRISYTFNLTGPSIAIDTACSSFHHALHFATHAIKQGDCEVALCAGVNCIIDPRTFISLTKAKMISCDGISKPFSTKADGYGRGEGCGVLLLKSLQKAQKDFSKIWGVISISAVNQNGRSVTPITRPSQQEQENLLGSIYPSRVDPSLLQYIEAHGTGTPAGDPTEAESIGNVIGKKRSPHLPALKMGSVKGNIGHTESAAGAAGLIKVLLMMHHGKIVPSLHFSESTSSIDTRKLNLSIPTRVENWEESSEFGRVAAVNCFGFGGTNAHVVVRQVKETQILSPVKRPVELFVISAASGHSLKLSLEDTARHVNTSGLIRLPNLAYTSACRRSHLNFKYRKAFVVSSLQDLEKQLLSAAEMELVPSKKAPQVIFVFSGNGLNLKGIFKTLLRSEPVFRDKCQEIEGLFQQWISLSILELTENGHGDLTRPEIAQPVLFILQVALVALLQHWGLKPSAVLGHSVGEVAAAHCAGFISLEDAVKVIYHRSRLQAKVTGGRMLVVGNIPVQEVSEAIGLYSGKVCIAAFNSPQSCTLSGDADSIHAVQKHLAGCFGGRDAFLHLLNIPAAYHSHMMDPVLEEIAGSLSKLGKQKPELEVISTVTGKAASEDDIVSGKYWARQVRDPVVFAQALMTSVKEKQNVVFVEIGPHRALQRNITETLGKQTQVFPSLQAGKEYEVLFTLLKGLFELGFNPDWPQIYDGYQSVPATYPRYQFDHKKLNSQINVLQQPIHQASNLNHPLIHSFSNDNTEFKCSISQAQTPYIYEHKHNGVTLVPGAFFVELALAAGMTSARPKVPLHFCQVMIRFTSPCVLGEGSYDLKVKMEQQKTVKEFRIVSSSDTSYASGQVTHNPEISVQEKNISYPDVFQRCKSFVSTDEIYEALSSFGFQYGSVFKQLSNVFYCNELKEGIAILKVNQETVEEMHDYFIHPVLLDCFLQMTGVMIMKSFGNYIAFPSAIGSLVITRPLEEEMMIYMKMSNSMENYVDFCGCFTDKHGCVLAEMKHVRITLMKETLRNETDFLYENKWKEITHSQIIPNMGKTFRVAVFADKMGIAQQLKKFLHKDSKFLMYDDWEKWLEVRSFQSLAQEKINLELRNYSDVWFMWGIQRLNEENPDSVVANLSKCCAVFQQIIVALRAKDIPCSIKTITFRATEKSVDHMNPGFALYGMVRSCMVEVPEMTFQMIDMSSTSTMDISVLADVLLAYEAQNYPEVWINQGRVYSSEIRRSQVHETAYHLPSQSLKNADSFTLFTCDPYEVRDLCAKLEDTTDLPLDDHCVEVQIERISLHSEDYFPVSVSSSHFGNTLYWHAQTVEKHKLLALDCRGKVVAIGSKTKKIRVGDHIVSCYPVMASSRIRIPEVVCLNTQKFPCFETVPCVSFFRIAWEVLHQTLPAMKQKGSLGIVSTEPESVLCRVLHLSAQEAGWKTICTRPDSNLEFRVSQCNALVFLTPLERLPKDLLAHLSCLRHVVVVCGNLPSDSLRSLIGSSHGDFQVHVLILASIFQKASLKQSQKSFTSWMKSMQLKQFKDLPCSVFQHANNYETVESALSYFASKSIHLAVLKSGVHNSLVSDIPVYEAKEKIFKLDAVYIVIGGLTGLGFETVRFIAENGGGGIVILSRRNPSVEKQKEISDMQQQNKRSRIITLQCNVVLRSDVEKAIGSISKIFPKCPIKGVFHSAVVLHDGSIETLTISDFEEVLSPKVAGAMNLHHATQGQELDYFVCYSSVASFLGNSLQVNYAAANSFLDLFCHYRRNCGLAGQSINWGALNLGLLQNQNEIQNLLESKGIEILQVNEFYDYLKRSLILNNPQQAVLKMNFKTLYNHFTARNPAFRSRMHTLITERLNTSELSEETTSKTVAPVKSEDYIMSLLNQVTSADLSDITMDTSLLSLGIDSMLAMTLQNRIFQEQQVDITLVKLLDPNATVRSLALMLEEKIEESKKRGTQLHVEQDPKEESWTTSL
ncbi:mycolipanoate synthase-like [Paroedura picta]|uniref:mycolipanoate synthase-like n=1 Tax=Paroedura picta TaxID=143630 RepID=UPI0040559F0E